MREEKKRSLEVGCSVIAGCSPRYTEAFLGSTANRAEEKYSEKDTVVVTPFLAREFTVRETMW